MKPFNRFIGRVPSWAYLLVLVAVFVNTVYIIYRARMPEIGITVKFENGYYIHDYIKPGGPGDKAGIKTGDTLVSMNLIPIEKWEYTPEVGDTVIAGILKNNREVGLPVIVGSILSSAPVFYWCLFISMILFSVGSLYLLYKKPEDKAVWLFFIYIQLFIVTANAQHLSFKDPSAIIAELAFVILGCFLGPTLIHFHLLFPRPVKNISRYKYFPLLFYTIGTLLAVGFSAAYFHDFNNDLNFTPVFDVFNRIALWWLTVTFILALATAIYQFLTIHDTLARNQLRIVITGAFFSCITPISITLFYKYVNDLGGKFPHLYALSQGIGGLIMIFCILVAVFRFRIWNIEIFIRKALLYLGATLIILLSYLMLIWLVDMMTISQTNISRFVILAISVIIFLILRDWIQRLIDRTFHRETYDSATVVSDFEEKLAGIYQPDELKSGIVQNLDEIFHFKSFVFALKTRESRYEPAVVTGIDAQSIIGEFEANTEFEQRLRKSKIFSPDELNDKPSIFTMTNGELVVPLLEGDQPNGFFFCGQKQSERVYSIQDIRVLSLLARRVTALFHTAGLYQKDLDRQLMLERERARISQDMHDDIGAGLTKIAMISEAPVKAMDPGYGNREKMNRIASSSREMISRLNVIVWALNPKYDNLDSLIAYLRRYFGEYLENFGIGFKTDFPDQIPEISLTPDTRRNIFYAIQEAIHNAVKHSGCSEISLVVKIRQQKMEITITDNGKGFDQRKVVTYGNGLLNMKKRAEDLGGSFEIQSSPGHGTRVLFTIRLY